MGGIIELINESAKNISRLTKELNAGFEKGNLSRSTVQSVFDRQASKSLDAIRLRMSQPGELSEPLA